MWGDETDLQTDLVTRVDFIGASDFVDGLIVYGLGGFVGNSGGGYRYHFSFVFLRYKVVHFRSIKKVIGMKDCVPCFQYSGLGYTGWDMNFNQLQTPILKGFFTHKGFSYC